MIITDEKILVSLVPWWVRSTVYVAASSRGRRSSPVVISKNLSQVVSNPAETSTWSKQWSIPDTFSLQPPLSCIPRLHTASHSLLVGCSVSLCLYIVDSCWSDPQLLRLLPTGPSSRSWTAWYLQISGELAFDLFFYSTYLLATQPFYEHAKLSCKPRIFIVSTVTSNFIHEVSSSSRY